MNDPQTDNYIALLKDREAAGRVSAVIALGKRGEAAVPALIDALKDGDPLVRRSAAEALGRLRDASAVPALREALQDADPNVRHLASIALVNAGVAAVPTLIEALEDRDLYVRYSAVRALGELGSVDAVPALIEALKDEYASVRQHAAVALGQIGEASAVPGLIKVLKDRAAPIRNRAAKALEQVGDAVTLPRKILAAQGFSTEERIDVLEKLRGLRYRDMGTTLRYTFPDTRTLCQEVLGEEDTAARAGAQSVLNWLNGDRHLVRASQSKDTLLRPVEGGNAQTPSDTLVRPADEPDEGT